jgi:hypothetical protein
MCGCHLWTRIEVKAHISYAVFCFPRNELTGKATNLDLSHLSDKSAMKFEVQNVHFGWRSSNEGGCAYKTIMLFMVRNRRRCESLL